MKINSSDTGRISLNRQMKSAGHQPQQVKKLLQAGANSDYQDEYGTTALMDACLHGHLETVEVLLAHGADPNLCGLVHPSIGVTALMRASAGKDARIVEKLIEAGAALNARDDLGETALHCAVANGELEIVTLLVEAGAELNARSYGSATALSYAQEREDEEITLFLESRGAV